MSDIYAVRIAGHGPTMNEIAAPCWPIGKFLRFKPEDHEGIGPGGFATYEPCDLARASFGTKREAEAIQAFMAKTYPHVICQIRRFVEAAYAVA